MKRESNHSFLAQQRLGMNMFLGFFQDGCFFVVWSVSRNLKKKCSCQIFNLESKLSRLSFK